MRMRGSHAHAPCPRAQGAFLVKEILISVESRKRHRAWSERSATGRLLLALGLSLLVVFSGLALAGLLRGGYHGDQGGKARLQRAAKGAASSAAKGVREGASKTLARASQLGPRTERRVSGARHDAASSRACKDDCQDEDLDVRAAGSCASLRWPSGS